MVVMKKPGLTAVNAARRLDMISGTETGSAVSAFKTSRSHGR